MSDETLGVAGLPETNKTDSSNNGEYITNLVYDPFDPDIEITRLLKSTTELDASIIAVVGDNEQAKSVLRKEREERLRNFKGEFINQKIAIAQLGIVLFEKITDNPDIETTELMGLVSEYAVKGSVSG